MEGGGMEAKDVFTLGLGLSEPWKLSGQRLDVEKRPNELHLEVIADRGALFPCPECQRACKAHDFESFTWQHLNFFQHHCFITARVPRVACPDHGVKRATVPWARPGSKFTLLFEQAALILVREMLANRHSPRRQTITAARWSSWWTRLGTPGLRPAPSRLRPWRRTRAESPYCARVSRAEWRAWLEARVLRRNPEGALCSALDGSHPDRHGRLRSDRRSSPIAASRRPSER